MSKLYPYTIDYSNRQVDMELLQSVPEPVELIRVNLSLTEDIPKIVTGIQKMAQRYAMLILSTLGQVTFDKSQGTHLVSQVVGSRIQNRGQLQIAFADANSRVLSAMRYDDGKPEIYGIMPDDESIVRATLLDFDIDFQQSVVYLRIHLVSKAGTYLTYIVPVSASRT